MTSPRPAPASHKLPLYIRNVSCDQWIRLSIDSSSTVAMLKDKALDRLGIGDEEPNLHFDITRLHSDNKVTGTALRQSHSRPGLSTATATVANDRSFLARAPRAVLAAEPRCGARQSSRPLVVAESIAARRQAELILGGDPGRGGPGSMPQTQISPHTQPTLHRTRHLRRAQSLGVSRTPASPRRDPGSAQHPSAGSPLLKRLPKTATSNESIASVLALAQATDMVLTSTPTSRVITTPSSSRDDPFQHTLYLKTQASISSLSGAGDDERSLSPQSVSLDLPRTSTDTNELEHAKSAEVIVAHTSSPPPVLERQDSARILRGNEVAKKCEEEALRRLNESLEKSHLVFGKLSTASPTELRQPPLSISTSSRSAEPYTHRRPTTMTANARRAQRQKQRAMEYLEVDDALQDDIDVEVEVAEPNVSDPTSSTHLRASSWVPPRGTVSSDDAEHKELSSDEASTKVDLEPLPGAMDLILCRTTADEAITPMSPASSSGASCTLESPHSLNTSSSRGQHVDLETTNEQRLWGTQLEADLAKRQRQGDKDDLSQTPVPLSISVHRRHRSGTIKAPASQSVTTSGVLNERVSAPILYEQKLPALPLPVKPASFSSLLPQEAGTEAAEAASLHAPTASLGLQRGSAIGSATSIASPAQVDSLLNQLRSSTSYCYESDGKRTSRSRRTAGQYCLFSFSKGMTLDENASLSSCRLRPFELLELHLHSTRHRVRLPRYHYTKSSTPYRTSGEDLSRHTPSTAFGASPMSPSRPPKNAVAAPPLLDCDYLDSFAHGWAYVHHPRGCPGKARTVGLACWKLRWLVVHQGYLCVFRRRPDPANEGLVARGREQGGEKGEERTKAGSASPQGLITKLNLSVISWISSELADGATNPVLRTLAQDLINVCFKSPSEHELVGARSETGPGSHHHIVSLRFLTDHAARCWYALFQRVHCRSQLARRGDSLKLEELANLQLRSNIDVFRGIADFLQQTEIDLPCPWDASVKVSVDDWRKRAYLRSLVAGRGGVILPGRSGRGGGRNALLKTRVTPVGGNVDAEDADLWSDHSEEEGVFTVQGDAFVCTDPSSSTVAPGSLMPDLQEFPGEVVLQQRATSMEEAVTTSTLIGEAKATSMKKRSKRPSTQGDGTHRLFQLGIPHHKSAINMDPSSWFPPPPPPPDSGSTDSTYKALAMRRNSFANLAAAFVGGGRLSSSHGRRPGTGKKGPPALARPELTRLQTNSRGPSVDMAKRSHESATLPTELTALSGDVTSASLRTTSLSAPIGMSTPLASTTTTSTSDSVSLEDSEAHTGRLTAGENLATKLIVSDSQVENCSSHLSALSPRPRALVLMHLSEPQRIPTPSNGSPPVLKSLVSEASASRPSTPRVSGALSPLRTQTVDNSAASGEGSGSRSPLIPPRSPYRTSLGRRAVQAEHVAVTRAPANGHGESEGQERRPSLAELPFLVLETTASSSAVAVLASPFKHEPLAGSASPSAHEQTSAASASIPTPTSQTTASLSHDASSPAASTNQLTSQQNTNAPLSGVQMSQGLGAAASSRAGTDVDVDGRSLLISASSLLLEEFAQQKKRGRGWSLSRFISKKG